METSQATIKHWRAFGVEEWGHVKEGAIGLVLGSLLPVLLFYVSITTWGFSTAVVVVSLVLPSEDVAVTVAPGSGRSPAPFTTPDTAPDVRVSVTSVDTGGAPAVRLTNLVALSYPVFVNVTWYVPGTTRPTTV